MLIHWARCLSKKLTFLANFPSVDTTNDVKDVIHVCGNALFLRLKNNNTKVAVHSGHICIDFD